MVVTLPYERRWQQPEPDAKCSRGNRSQWLAVDQMLSLTLSHQSGVTQFPHRNRGACYGGSVNVDEIATYPKRLNAHTVNLGHALHLLASDLLLLRHILHLLS